MRIFPDFGAEVPYGLARPGPNFNAVEVAAPSCCRFQRSASKAEVSGDRIGVWCHNNVTFVLHGGISFMIACLSYPIPLN